MGFVGGVSPSARRQDDFIWATIKLPHEGISDQNIAKIAIGMKVFNMCMNYLVSRYTNLDVSYKEIRLASIFWKIWESEMHRPMAAAASSGGSVQAITLSEPPLTHCPY